MPHHFQKTATATSIEKLTAASTVISQVLVLLSQTQVELLVAPDEVGVEDLLVGERSEIAGARDQNQQIEDRRSPVAPRSRAASRAAFSRSRR